MLTFETWDIEKLIPYDRNPRVNEHAVDKISAAIKEYGFRVPIVAKSDGLIVDGHLRFKAARKLGLTEIPVILADDLTDAQIKAFRLSVNKIAELAEWDEDMLKIELQELYDIGYDIDIIGFTDEELEDMDINLEGDLKVLDESKADDVPEVVENPVIKLGDLIELGNHRLLCGDSTSEEDVKKLMDGVKADMVFTDPPYGVDYKGIRNDDEAGLFNLLDLAFKNIAKSAKKGGAVYVFHADRTAHHFHNTFRKYFHFSSMIVWNKTSLVLSQTDYQSKHEPCMYGWVDGGTHEWHSDRKQTSVWDFEAKKFDGHTTPKPVELIERALFNSSKTHNVVVDLFGGSGSTLIACENLTRKARIMELDEKYAQVIVQRWCDYTSIDTIKINGVEVSWNEYKLQK